MKYLTIIIFLLNLNSKIFTEQQPDILYFNNEKILIENYPLNQKLKTDLLLKDRIKNKIVCITEPNGPAWS